MDTQLTGMPSTPRRKVSLSRPRFTTRDRDRQGFPWGTGKLYGAQHDSDPPLRFKCGDRQLYLASSLIMEFVWLIADTY